MEGMDELCRECEGNGELPDGSVCFRCVCSWGYEPTRAELRAGQAEQLRALDAKARVAGLSENDRREVVSFASTLHERQKP